jgi:hypothetical protein
MLARARVHQVLLERDEGLLRLSVCFAQRTQVLAILVEKPATAILHQLLGRAGLFATALLIGCLLLELPAL